MLDFFESEETFLLVKERGQGSRSYLLEQGKLFQAFFGLFLFFFSLFFISCNCFVVLHFGTR